MPLYEYQCRKCGHRFERIRKFSDPPVKKCPECGGRVQQLLSPPAVQFKGSGWYVTDYARKGAPPSGDSEPAAKPEVKAEKAEAKAETKPKGEPKKGHGKK
ncbi:MAG TPA: zinc ribbon domain-containing protein [Terriglobales bacterium]|nr:zinc ribbon domain-containing protein [Terriglobales bacterium]